MHLASLRTSHEERGCIFHGLSLRSPFQVFTQREHRPLLTMRPCSCHPPPLLLIFSFPLLGEGHMDNTLLPSHPSIILLFLCPKLPIHHPTNRPTNHLTKATHQILIRAYDDIIFFFYHFLYRIMNVKNKKLCVLQKEGRKRLS